MELTNSMDMYDVELADRLLTQNFFKFLQKLSNQF